MNNVDAPSELTRCAASNQIDLTVYNETLEDLKRLGKFIDPEPPFAADVLRRLQTGASVDDAVDAAKASAIESLRASD